MVMKYLDPKADLTFKKIFGNHPKRLISLLNALLPLSEEEQIHEIKYLPTELVPQLEGGKNTIVDVLCTDVRGRKFCVEMQMEWSDAFQQRVLFNASKLYVSQAKKGGKYSELQPVYSLNLINDIFAHDTPDFIHNLRGGSRKSDRGAGLDLSGGGAAPFSPVSSSTASVKLLPKNSMTKSTGPPPLLWLCLYHLFPRTVRLSCRFQRYSFPARVSCSPCDCRK